MIKKAALILSLCLIAILNCFSQDFSNVNTINNPDNLQSIRIPDSAELDSIKNGGIRYQTHVDAGTVDIIEDDLPITSIMDSELALFEIYPNPARNSIIMNVGQEHRIRILNSIGMELMSYEIFRGENLIDVSKLASGTYLVLSENSDGQLKTQKLIIQRR